MPSPSSARNLSSKVLQFRMDASVSVPFCKRAPRALYALTNSNRSAPSSLNRTRNLSSSVCTSKPTSSYIFSARAMILKELSRILVEELGANPVAPGDAARPIHGPAVEEPTEGWLEKDEVAVTSREDLDGAFLRSVRESGSPVVVWRRDAESSPEIEERAAELGLGLYIVSPEVPLRRLLSIFSGDDGRSEERRVGKECRSRWS